MIMKKITKRNIYEALINFANGGNLEFRDGENVVELFDNDLKAFAENELNLLDKKAEKAKERKAEKKKEDPLYDEVKAALSYDWATIADITEDVSNSGIAEVTASKVAYRLRVLVDEGIAVKKDARFKDEEGKSRTAKVYKLYDEAEDGEKAEAEG